MTSTNVRDDVLVVDMRLNINLQNSSIENVVSRMKNANLSLYRCTARATPPRCA